MKKIKITAYKNFRRKEFTINTHSNEYISRILERSGTFYEIDILEFCSSLLPRCRYVLDVGANIGNHTIYWAAVCNSEVQSFEPYSENFELLEKNIVGNGVSYLVHAHRVALGAVAGVAKLNVVEPANMGMVKVQSQENGVCSAELKNTAEVKTLDDCLQEIMPEYVDLIKIDTEGYEVNVIRGGAGVLKEYQPLIWVEIWSEDFLVTIRELLESAGYVWSVRYRTSHNYFFSKAAHPLFVTKLKWKTKSILRKRILPFSSRLLSDTRKFES